jgi:hypothetical protein
VEGPYIDFIYHLLFFVRGAKVHFDRDKSLDSSPTSVSVVRGFESRDRIEDICVA